MAQSFSISKSKGRSRERSKNKKDKERRGGGDHSSSVSPPRKKSRSSPPSLASKDSVDFLSSQNRDLVSFLPVLLSKMIDSKLTDRVLVPLPSLSLEGLPAVSLDMPFDQDPFYDLSYLRQEVVVTSTRRGDQPLDPIRVLSS